MRSRSSAVAARVKVTMRIREIGIPCSATIRTVSAESA